MDATPVAATQPGTQPPAAIAGAEVLVPDTPDEAFALSGVQTQTERKHANAPAGARAHASRSPVARNLFEAMELTEPHHKAPAPGAPAPEMAAAHGKPDARMAGGDDDEPLGVLRDSAWSDAAGTPSSRTTSDQQMPGTADQVEENQVTVITGGEVNRIRLQLGMSPGSVEPNQSLALDPTAASAAWNLLATTRGAESSSASLPQLSGGTLEESNEEGPPAVPSPSDHCPTTPFKKPAVSRLSLNQNASSSHSSLESSDAVGAGRLPLGNESQDFTLVRNGLMQDGEDIATPQSASPSRKLPPTSFSAVKGSYTGRSSVRGKENRDLHPPRRFRVTPVPLVLSDEISGDTSGAQKPAGPSEIAKETRVATFSIRPALADSRLHNVDVEMTDEKEQEGFTTLRKEAVPERTKQLSLKRGLFQSVRKKPSPLVNSTTENQALIVSAFTTAKGSAVALSRKRLEDMRLHHEINERTVHAPEKEAEGPSRKQPRDEDYDPFMPASKAVKRPRESLESMVLNENGPNTPFLQRRVPASASMFTTAKGAPVPAPSPIHLNQAKNILEGTDKHSFNPPFAPMFTTGKGVPLRTPSTRELELARQRLEKPAAKELQGNVDSAVQNELHPGFRTPFQVRKQPGLAMFTTGKGKPIAPPSARQLEMAKRRFEAVEMSTPMFSEVRSGASKNSRSAIAANERVSEPSHNLPSRPLFTTGHGRQVNIPIPNQPLARVLPFNLATSPRDPPAPRVLQPRENSGEINHMAVPDSAKRVSFDALPGSSLKPPGILQTGISSSRRLLFQTPPAKARGFPKAANSRVRSSALKGTPFKRPRKLAPVIPKQTSKPSAASLPQTNHLFTFFPKSSVPKLSVSGRLLPNSAMAIDTPELGSNIQNTSVAGFPVSVENPEQALSVVLFKENFGDWGQLPKEVQRFIKFNSITTFSVENCMALLCHVFPIAGSKAATRVGSRAWTRLSYALAVWKLSRLDKDRQNANQLKTFFLTAANVVRELWRRVDREWHRNSTPHLPQMIRQDASPRSHIILIVSGIIFQGKGGIALEVSDGWYICRLKLCDVLAGKVRAGLLNVGDKIHVSECDLLSVSNPEPFFFGDGDELCSNVLSAKANCVRKVKTDLVSKSLLGMRQTALFIRSLKGLHPAGGLCPGAQVVVIRSHPVFFIESSRDSEKRSVFRRQEAEETAQLAFENELRESRVSGENRENDVQSRSVSTAIDLTVTGIHDANGGIGCERIIRIYRPSEDVLKLVSTEGNAIQLPPLKPNGKFWVALNSAVRPVTVSNPSVLPKRPRRAYSCAELLSEEVTTGSDFDGVYTVLHLAEPSPDSMQRFVFLLDNLDKLSPIALELKDVDAEIVPRAFFKAKTQGQYPIVALKDATKTGIDAERGIIHATATLRTELISGAALKRRKGSAWAYLQDQLEEMERSVGGDPTKTQAKLDVNREAVMSFLSGRRQSIGAYFSSTQDSQPQS